MGASGRVLIMNQPKSYRPNARFESRHLSSAGCRWNSLRFAQPLQPAKPARQLSEACCRNESHLTRSLKIGSIDEYDNSFPDPPPR